jgi:hypothetical protein
MFKITKGARMNKDRRSGKDRRQFSYAVHIPERRFGLDRRKKRITPHFISPKFYAKYVNSYR